jgi:sugar O-acyltransferase (sialic acid O-acetyltransferase NeuD family)
MKKVVIIGAGGFGREVLDVFDAVNAVKPTFDVQGFIVDPIHEPIGTLINDKPILGDFSWFKGKTKDVEAFCAIGAPEVRWKVVNRAKDMGVKFCNAIHPRAIITKWVEIGEGVVITAGCIFTNQIKVGSHVIVNLGCMIGHDVRIGSFVTLNPSANLMGNVVVDDGVAIQTGAVVTPRIHIGEWSVVGAGANVLKDIPANTLAYGNPCKVMKTKDPGWYKK